MSLRTILFISFYRLSRMCKYTRTTFYLRFHAVIFSLRLHVTPSDYTSSDYVRPSTCVWMPVCVSVIHICIISCILNRLTNPNSGLKVWAVNHVPVKGFTSEFGWCIYIILEIYKIIVSNWFQTKIYTWLLVNFKNGWKNQPTCCAHYL